MKVTFIIPFTYLTGGIRVIFEHANRLRDRGHAVSIIYPLVSYSERRWHNPIGIYKRLRGTFENIIKGTTIKWFSLRADLIRVPFVSDFFIPDADIVVATAWPTAYSVKKLSKAKGEKGYFIQGYEIDSGPRQLVDNTYLLALNQITVAPIIRRLLKEKFDKEVMAVVLVGVNLKQFYNDNKTYNKTQKILMYYNENIRKGSDDGIKALEIVKKSFPQVSCCMFGRKRGKNIPNYVKFYRRPTHNQLRKIYCAADIFLYPSRYEGFGLPPMEAMACECAVVTTNVGAISEYSIPGETALVSQPGDPEALALNIMKLLDNAKELKRISIAGHQYIKNFTWDKATDKLEKVFEQILRQKNR